MLDQVLNAFLNIAIHLHFCVRKRIIVACDIFKIGGLGADFHVIRHQRHFFYSSDTVKHGLASLTILLVSNLSPFDSRLPFVLRICSRDTKKVTGQPMNALGTPAGYFCLTEVQLRCHGLLFYFLVMCDCTLPSK